LWSLTSNRFSPKEQKNGVSFVTIVTHQKVHVKIFQIKSQQTVLSAVLEVKKNGKENSPNSQEFSPKIETFI